MSGIVERTERSEFRSPIPRQWIAMIVLAVLELVVVSIQCDSEVFSRSQGLVGYFANHLPLVPQLLAVTCAATLVFGSKELTNCRQEYVRDAGYSSRGLLGTHLFAFTLFLFSCLYFFEIDAGQSLGIFALWLLLAGATAATWFSVLVAPRVWLPFMKALSGPILMGTCMGVFAWLAGRWTTQVWCQLAFATFHLVRIILTLFCVQVVEDSSTVTIGTSEFSVTISPECSGYEGMGLGVVFIATYLWWNRRDHIFPQSLLLIPASVGLMFIVNALRIAALILIGHLGAQEIALGGFHSQAGWIGFNLVALGLVAFARTTQMFCVSALPESVADEKDQAENRAIPMLAPFVCLTLLIMVLGSFQTGFDWLYPVRFFGVATVVCICFRQYPQEYWKGNLRWSAVAIGLAVYVIWNFLETNDGGVAKNLYESSRSLNPVLFIFWLAFRIVGSVITVPLAEELAFRGYLLPWIAGDHARGWSWGALVVSSVAFGLLHPGRWVAGTIAGLLYGFAYYRNGRVMDAVIAHATTNALIAVEAVFWSHWYLWG